MGVDETLFQAKLTTWGFLWNANFAPMKRLRGAIIMGYNELSDITPDIHMVSLRYTAAPSGVTA